MAPEAQELIGLSTAELAELPVLQGQPAFRARQIASWIYARGAHSFAEMSDLSRPLRAALEGSCSLRRLAVRDIRHSRDGATRKYLLDLPDGLPIEVVLMRSPRRDTLCISTQVGCAHDCRFCATAAMGLARNLTVHEIISQVLILREELRAGGAPGHFNLVFMGMGEPLANYDALTNALTVLHEDHGLAVGRRRMTISTVGLVPQIERLATEPVTVRLALSLNATTNQVRSRLMPINRRYPIEVVLPALGAYGRATGNRITLEYLLLRGWNDTPADAERLARMATEHGCKINLIGFNPYPGSELAPSPPATMQRFQNRLLPIAPAVTVRESRGGDIAAACGQLYAARRRVDQQGKP